MKYLKNYDGFIFVYELNSNTVASFALNDYYEDDLYSILKKVETSKRELIWYMMKNGKDFDFTKVGEKIEPLHFEDDVDDFFEELVCNMNSSITIYDFVSDAYDELISEDKEKWKERSEFVNYIGNHNRYVYLEDDDTDDNSYSN